MSARHLEIMLAGATAHDYAEIREFLETRGYRIQESRKADVLCMWCEAPLSKFTTRRGPDGYILLKRKEESIAALDLIVTKDWPPATKGWRAA